jgi:hypothetical protein
VALLFEGAAIGAHPVGPTGRVAPLVVEAVTVGALERQAKPAPTTLGGDHPLALLPGRTVTDVLTMATFE